MNHAAHVGFFPNACTLIEVEAVDMTDFRGGIVGCYVEIFVVGGDNEARNLLTTVASQRGSGGEITFESTL